MQDRINSQIDIEIRPVQMVRLWALHMKHSGDRSIAKPGELLERHEKLSSADEQVHTGRENSSYFNYRSDVATPRGFHLHAFE